MHGLCSPSFEDQVHSLYCASIVHCQVPDSPHLRPSTNELKAHLTGSAWLQAVQVALTYEYTVAVNHEAPSRVANQALTWAISNRSRPFPILVAGHPALCQRLKVSGCTSNLAAASMLLTRFASDGVVGAESLATTRFAIRSTSSSSKSVKVTPEAMRALGCFSTENLAPLSVATTRSAVGAVYGF
jgi:hypothetical protein